jgi:hypothetical protein
VSLCTSHYGSPVPGTKVFLRCHLMTDGFQSVARIFSGIVPAAA